MPEQSAAAQAQQAAEEAGAAAQQAAVDAEPRPDQAWAAPTAPEGSPAWASAGTDNDDNFVMPPSEDGGGDE